MKRSFLDDGYSSRKLIFALLIVLLSWIVGQRVDNEKLKILCELNYIIFAIYSGANIGGKFASVSYEKAKTIVSSEKKELKKEENKEEFEG